MITKFSVGPRLKKYFQDFGTKKIQHELCWLHFETNIFESVNIISSFVANILASRNAFLIWTCWLIAVAHTVHWLQCGTRPATEISSIPLAGSGCLYDTNVVITRFCFCSCKIVDFFTNLEIVLKRVKHFRRKWRNSCDSQFHQMLLTLKDAIPDASRTRRQLLREAGGRVRTVGARMGRVRVTWRSLKLVADVAVYWSVCGFCKWQWFCPGGRSDDKDKRGLSARVSERNRGKRNHEKKANFRKKTKVCCREFC